MRVTVVGLGLIGGSLAKAALRAGHAVTGVDLAPPENAPFETSRPDGASRFLADSRLVLVALPPRAVPGWIREHAGQFADGAVVVDASGVKGTICAELREFAFQDRWTFIGGHPMAGKEVSGFAASEAELFKDASMILTPYPSCSRKPLDMLDGFFRGLGFSRVVVTTPEHHDRMIALTSQLAHVVSSAYIQDPLAPEHDGYSAGSFRDMTRVARLDPDMWTDLMLSNREALSEVLGGLIDRLSSCRRALDGEDAGVLRQFLSRGLSARLASW